MNYEYFWKNKKRAKYIIQNILFKIYYSKYIIQNILFKIYYSKVAGFY